MSELTRRLIDDIAARHPRLVAAMLMASSAALLATGVDGPDRFYRFEYAGPTARVELTETAPGAVIRVTARALGRGKHGIDTTDGASIALDGSVQVSGNDPLVTAPSVSVRVDNGDSDAESLAVARTFRTERTLTFSGDCSTFVAEDPCVALTTIELARSDSGAAGGVVTVDITTDFTKTSLNEDTYQDVTYRLPWSVELATE